MGFDSEYPVWDAYSKKQNPKIKQKTIGMASECLKKLSVERLPICDVVVHI